MNLVKKFAYTSMALMLALGISACGNNDGNVEEKNKTETSENAENKENKENKDDKKDKDAKDDEVPTLTYLNIGTPQAGTEETVSKINEYLDEKEAGYHLNLVFYDWGDYEQRLQLASSTGEDWDLAFTASWAGPYKTLVSQNALMDLTELMEGKEFVDLINPDMLKGVSVDGKVYGIPAAYPGVVAANQFVWTKSMVDKYNIDYKNIQNIDQLEPIFEEIKEKEGVQYPFGVDKGYISPSAPQVEPGTVMPENEVLLTEGEGEPGSAAIWSVAPRNEVVSNIIGDKVLISNDKATGKMISINSQTDKADLAMDFINRMFTDKNLQDMLSYGVEGKNFEYKDGKVVKHNKDSDGIDNDYDVPSFTFLCAFNRTPLDGAPGIGDEEFDKEAKEFEDKLVASPVLGFTLDESKIATEIANVQQTQSEYTINLKTGAFDESYYQEFLDKLNTAGIEKVIEEVQAQLDNWEGADK